MKFAQHYLLELWQFLENCTFLLVGLAIKLCSCYSGCLTLAAPFNWWNQFILACLPSEKLIEFDIPTMSHSSRPTFHPNLYGMQAKSKTFIFILVFLQRWDFLFPVKKKKRKKGQPQVSDIMREIIHILPECVYIHNQVYKYLDTNKVITLATTI